MKKPSFAEVDKRCRNSLIPLYGYIAVTAKCNLNCAHCYVIKHQEPELSTEEIKSSLSQLANLGCLFLSITGGEIFTRQDIFEILKYAKKNKFCITLLTNGTLIDRSIIKSLKRIGIKAIGISVYGDTSELHEKITRVRGSFMETMRAISLLSEEKFNFYVKYILTNQNWQGFKKLTNRFKKRNINLIALSQMTPKEDGTKAPLRLRIKKSQVHKFYADNLNSIKNSLLFDVAERVKLKNLLFEDGIYDICGAGKSSIFIDAYGDVRPCVVFPISMGNIRKDSFTSIWRRESSISTWIRALTINCVQGCRDCKNLKYCIICPGQSLLEYNKLRNIPLKCSLIEEELRLFKKLKS